MREEITNIRNEAFARIMEADSEDELERIRINYLGRKGSVTELFKKLSDIPQKERKEIGILLNDIKSSIEQNIKDRKNDISKTKEEWFDPTIPGKKPLYGNLHIITQAVDEISKIFEGIGFSRKRYPEVEWDWYAFGALNFPENHPAKDDMETFTVDAPTDNKLGKMILTPHTSSGQVREMERVNATPPIRMLNIAKCYRRESDASHFPQFHQFEGLVVDKNIDITHLRGTLDHFVKHYYGLDVKTRLRPHNFKFTEPSLEVDITCTVCGGNGCKICKEGWLELGGAGMVHPNVLKSGEIDTEKYTGFAFGWGVERALMMKPGIEIPDLRDLYSMNLNVLRQF